jgi:hypothetical protein
MRKLTRQPGAETEMAMLMTSKLLDAQTAFERAR